MKIFFTYISVPFLLLACVGEDNNGTIQPPPPPPPPENSNALALSGVFSNAGTHHNFLELVNGKKAILRYLDGYTDESFQNAQLSADGKFLHIFGKDIDITQASEDGEIKVFRGNPELNSYLHRMNSNYSFLDVGYIEDVITENFTVFVVGETTASMPTNGSFTYVGKYINPSHEEKTRTYTVNFDKKTIKAYLSKSENYEANIHGNTFKSDSPLEYSVTDNSGALIQYKSYLTGAFFGSNAEEMAGNASRSEKKQGEEWGHNSYIFAAKKQ